MGRMRHATNEPGETRAIVVSANSFWNILNFRKGLIGQLEALGYRVKLAAPAPEQPAASDALASRLTPIPVDRSGLNPLADLRLLMAYVKLFRSERPMAFLSFTIKPNIYGALAARLTGVPSMPNVSGLGTAFLNGGLFAHLIGWLYWIAFRHSRIVFFQNPDDLQLFVERGLVRPDQARLLPGSGVDLVRFQPTSPATAGPLIFLFVGRLLGDKGVREYAEAAALLRDAMPNARFQLLGALDQGNRTAVSRQELDRWIDQGLIEYLGETGDVRPFIAAATAVVLPSYREGLPRSLLEAAAMGKPLIATDVPGNREICEDGVTGLMCAVRDGASLATAMKRFAALDTGARDALGTAARGRVEQRFSEEVVIGAYREALQQLTLSGG